jgi:hypothetical protein
MLKLLLGSLLVSLSAFALGPIDCQTKVGKFDIDLDREKFVAQRDVYKLELEFQPNQGGFSYAVNWLHPKAVTLNQETLVEKWNDPQTTQGTCNGMITPEKCLSRLHAAALYLVTSRKIILRNQPDYQDKLAAIQCAERRLASYEAAVKHHIRLR